MRAVILCVLLNTPSLTLATELNPAAVGTARSDSSTLQNFVSSWNWQQPYSNGTVEFDLRGLQVALVTQATLSLTFDEFYHNEYSYPNQGYVPLGLAYARGDGVVDSNDYMDGWGGLRCFVTYPGMPIQLDVTTWIRDSLNNGWDYVSFRAPVWADRGTGGVFQFDYVWAAAYGSPHSGSDGILANNFRLTITPEPA